MSKTLNIAIAGLGTVGAAAAKLLQDNAELLRRRCGAQLQVVAVSARSKGKDRGVSLGAVKWVDDARALADLPDVDLVVELIGGSEGVAKELVERAIANGKHVVTANKALIAHHGIALAALAEKHDVMLAFEAAVAGGIPIIDTLRHGLSANAFHIVAGILNGTCNYILTTMQKQGRAFEDVLKEAQDLGYAEADPSFDVDGIDTAHKLAILTSLAYGTPVDIDSIQIEGIRHITDLDMRYIAELGYTVKLLGIAQKNQEGILQRVHPALVPKHAPIGVIDGAFNAIHVEGDAVGRVLLEGRGAGGGPTASSVVADIVQVARGVRYPAFTMPVSEIKALPQAQMSNHVSSYYIRLAVKDQPGVLANITAIFAEQAISVRSIIQHTHDPLAPAQIVITTHDTRESAMRNALQQFASLTSVVETPNMIRIEKL